MTNILLNTPRITGFTHALRDFNGPQQSYTPQGDLVNVIQKQEKHVLFQIKYGTSVATTTLNHDFKKESGELCSVDELLANAGVDAIALWEAAFDVAKEKFALTADPDDALRAVGIPFWLRLEQTQANLNLKDNMGLVFKVGVYSDAAMTQLVNMFEMAFVDKKTVAARATSLVNLETQKKTLEDMVAGTHPNQTNMSSADLAKSKAQAADELTVQVARIQQHNDALIGSLKDILVITEVKNAFGAIARAAFTEFTKKLVSWKDINVDVLMSAFPAALQEVIDVA